MNKKCYLVLNKILIRYPDQATGAAALALVEPAGAQLVTERGDVARVLGGRGDALISVNTWARLLERSDGLTVRTASEMPQV